MLKKWLAIVNPYSGRQKNQTQFERLLAVLKNTMAACMVTEYPGHAEELARNAFDFDGLAVVGGDGTLFEVLRGMDVTRQQVAILPYGTGNSLARDVRIRTVFQGLQAIRPENLNRIDLLRISVTTHTGLRLSCYAASTLGLGYPAQVTITANQRFKRFGRWCYPVAATLETWHTPRFSAQIEYAGYTAEWGRFTGLLINNTQHAGNFRAFPDAVLNDGQLHVMTMQAGMILQTLHNLAVLSQTYFYSPCQVRRTTAVSITLQQPQWLMVDGELIPHVTHLTVQIAPNVLQLYSLRERRPPIGLFCQPESDAPGN